jgi:hypothetical protein
MRQLLKIFPLRRQAEYTSKNVSTFRKKLILSYSAQKIKLEAIGLYETSVRTVVWPEGLHKCIIPMTPQEIEAATFRLLARCLKQLRQGVHASEYSS